MTPALFALLIVVARVGDVSLGTIRTLMLMRGLRAPAAVIGFFESLIWVLAVSGVVRNLDEPLYVVAFAAGFALGNFVGITLERRIALGRQMLRIFTREADTVVTALRAEGFGVTKLAGEGLEGPVDLLLIQLPRRRSKKATDIARTVDPECYYVVDEVTAVSPSALAGKERGWRGILKRK
ncbi:MAG: DUF5698 domain-containing protein [Bacteroidota bacterium]